MEENSTVSVMLPKLLSGVSFLHLISLLAHVLFLHGRAVSSSRFMIQASHLLTGYAFIFQMLKNRAENDKTYFENIKVP